MPHRAEYSALWGYFSTLLFCGDVILFCFG